MAGPSFRERVRQAAAAQHINQKGEGVGAALANLWNNTRNPAWWDQVGGPALMKDMQTLPERAGSILMQPVNALDRFGRTLTGQEGGYGLEYDPSLGRVVPGDQLFSDANNLSGMLTLGSGALPGIPGALNMGIKAPRANPNFDRYFGGSKVVDAEGKPLVVYHATGADFEAFNPSRGVTFLSLTPDGAMKGAGGGSYDLQQRGSADRIMPLYVRAEAIEHTQPPKQVVAEIEALPDEISVERYDQLREGRDFYFTRALSYAFNDSFERGGKWFVRKDMVPLFKPLEEVARTGRDWMGQILPGYNTGLDADAKMGTDLAKRGYDATLVSDESGVALVIPDPTQIKSIYNRGTFDPNAPNITRGVLGGVPNVGRAASTAPLRLET